MQFLEFLLLFVRNLYNSSNTSFSSQFKIIHNFFLLSLSVYLYPIYSHTFLLKAIGSDGLAFPYLILEICDESNAINLDISLIFIFSLQFNVLFSLLNSIFFKNYITVLVFLLKLIFFKFFYIKNYFIINIFK